MNMIKQFEEMLATGVDNALLRFTLGKAYLDIGEFDQAVTHLRVAVGHDPSYSAAWKALAKALTAADQLAEALVVYERGIQVAKDKGDLQAAKEMHVLLRRLRRSGIAQ